MSVRFSANEYKASRCKAIGHDWDLVPNNRRAPWGSLMTLRCTECHSVREDIYSFNGELTHRVYEQPDWYKDVDQYSKAVWRSIYFAHLARQKRKSEVVHNQRTKK